MMICLQKQTDYLIAKLMQTMEKQFLKEGGFRERMTRMRIEERNKNKNKKNGNNGNEAPPFPPPQFP
jgi:four helix bundle suffix protein